ncbi:DUF6443 domain-containing protein, partial [Tenacibaculum maritimum]|uniref:DUF6443 domain-containing protein n=1 Tax=Tenacibaculum maritimum TaxID=107401 RepID=UPI0038772BE5
MMKKMIEKIAAIVLVGMPLFVQGQTESENYIVTKNYKVASSTPIKIIDTESVTTTVEYLDGLGRTKQHIVVAGGKLTGVLTPKDIVTHYAYDELGRQAKEYLAYAVESGSGAIVSGDVGRASQSYYQEKYGNDFLDVSLPEVNSYSEKEFEKSPLNRVLKQSAPGHDWRLGGGHEIVFDYQTNKEMEVRIYEVSLNAAYEPTLKGGIDYYGVGELYKTITRDENHSGTSKNHTTETFKNKQGQVILKRTYNKSIPHDTYYVYDDFGNLSFVIPPKVTFPISDEAMNNLCYQYKYDSRNRLIEKKLPGKGWEFIVYDNLDRPVLTQDSNLKQKQQWLYTKYDVLGRVAYTGVYVDVIGRSRASAQADIDSYVSGNATRHYEVLGDFSTYAGVPIYYGNRAYPNSRSLDIFTINYYDRYLDLPIGLENRITTSYGVMSTLNTKGLSTVRKTRVLDTNQWITNVTYYDEKGRVIYVYSKNDYLRTVDIVEHKLDDFTGKVIETKTTH